MSNTTSTGKPLLKLMQVAETFELDARHVEGSSSNEWVAHKTLQRGEWHLDYEIGDVKCPVPALSEVEYSFFF